MNAITIDADVFAPDSSITSGGPFTMTGALTIGDFTANNNIAITFQAAGGSGSSSAPATFYPSAHVSCIPSSTPGGTDGAC